MTTWFFVKLAIRLVAFTAVFWFATRPRRDKDGKPDQDGKPAMLAPRITIQPRWAIPLVGLLFGALNTLLYALFNAVLDVATLRTFSLVMPLIVNALLLWGTARVVERKQWLKIASWWSAIWLALALTIAHGVLWLALDYIPG